MTTDTNDRQRWIALYVLCTGMLMIVLDITVVNVALPSIQEDLGFTASGLAWVVNGYLIAFGGLLLLAGRLGDLLGRKNIFLVGLAIFVGASFLCGIAQSQEVLVGARFIQGVGGALTSAVVLGMIVTMFPEPRDQAKAIGVFAFVASAGGSIGLLAGGVLTDSHQLALDLLHQHPDRDRHRGLRQSPARARQGHRLRQRRRRPGRRADHLVADAWRLHDRQARGGAGLGLEPGAAAERGLAGPSRGVHRSRGHAPRTR